MGSDVDAVTKSGRLFHTRAAATGNEPLNLTVKKFENWLALGEVMGKTQELSVLFLLTRSV